MAGAHLKVHAINDALNHSGGTNGTVLATEGGVVVEKSFGTTAVAATIVQRATGGHVVVPSGATGSNAISADDAQSKVDSAIAGLKVKGAVEVLNMISDLLTTPPGGPVTGDAYVLAGVGGAWSGFAVGDIVVWTGSVWAKVVSNSGGVVPTGKVVVITGLGNGTAAGAFATHGGAVATKIAGSWAFDAAQNGYHVVVDGDNDPNDNSEWVYDTSVGPAWRYFRNFDIPAHNSTTSIQGGSSTERYHLTAAQQLLAIARKTDVSLAGTEPALADLTTLTQDGDWLLAAGTSNLAFLCIRKSTRKYAVELAEITT